MATLKREWEEKLNGWTYSNVEANSERKIKPRIALRELEKALAGKEAIVSTDIGNICSVSNSYLRFDGMCCVLFSEWKVQSEKYTVKYVL